MARTLSEAIEELTQLKHRRTIYEQMVGFLTQYVPDEMSADEDPQELETVGVGAVPIDLLQDTITDLEENGINALDDQIKNLEKTEISDEQEPKEKPKKKPSPKSASTAGGKGGKGAGEADAAGSSSAPDKRTQLRRRRKAKNAGARAS